MESWSSPTDWRSWGCILGGGIGEDELGDVCTVLDDVQLMEKQRGKPFGARKCPPKTNEERPGRMHVTECAWGRGRNRGKNTRRTDDSVYVLYMETI